MAIIGWGLTTYIEVLSKNGVPMKKASFISQILSMPFIMNCYLRDGQGRFGNIGWHHVNSTG